MVDYKKEYEKLVVLHANLEEDYAKLTNTQTQEDIPKNVKHHLEIVKRLNSIYQEKNRLYGDSFTNTVEKYGYIAALTRMADKWARIESMILQDVKGDGMESLEDAMLDLSNYLIMSLMVLEGGE